MFKELSEGAKRVLFLMREVASTKGNTALIEPSHLLDALVREDQGEFAARMPNVARIKGKRELRQAHPFFSAETASALLVNIEPMLPLKAEEIPFSTDMAPSAALERIFNAATELAKQLHTDEVEPLHLLAGILSQESERSSDLLRQGGISREAVIAAIRAHLS